MRNIFLIFFLFWGLQQKNVFTKTFEVPSEEEVLSFEQELECRIFDFKELEKKFPTLVRLNVGIEGLVAHLVNVLKSAKDLKYCNCKNASTELRLLFVLHFLDAVLARYPLDLFKNEVFVHTEFGEEGGMQAYLHLYALWYVGYKNIVCNLITLGDDPLKKIQDALHAKDIRTIILKLYNQGACAYIDDSKALKSHSFTAVDLVPKRFSIPVKVAPDSDFVTLMQSNNWLSVITGERKMQSFFGLSSSSILDIAVSRHTGAYIKNKEAEDGFFYAIRNALKQAKQLLGELGGQEYRVELCRAVSDVVNRKRGFRLFVCFNGDFAIKDDFAGLVQKKAYDNPVVCVLQKDIKHYVGTYSYDAFKFGMISDH